PALDFAKRLEIVVEYHAVARTEITLQAARPIADAIEQALGLGCDRGALFRRVSFAEQLREYLARVEFHRQRRVRVAERERRVVEARRSAARGGLLRRLRGYLERRQRRV